MRYRIGVAALVLMCAAVTTGSPFAGAKDTQPTGLEPGTKDNGLHICEEEYLVTYAKAQEKLGSAAVGANLVDDGVLGNGTREPISNQQACSETDRLNALLNPAPAPEPVSDAGYAETETYDAASTTSSGTGGAIPSYITQCESGGDYSAVNPSSGAYGAYQIMPSTASAYGCDLGTPAGQDACAAEIYADVGASAWSCG